MEEFFEEQARETACLVADEAMFLQEVVENDSVSELSERREIHGHGLGALGAIAPRDFRRHRLAIGDNPINDAMRNVLLNRAKMIGERVAGGFAGLGHEVGNIHARSFGSGDGVGDFRDQEIRENTGIERPGTKKNQVGLLDGFDGLWEGAHAAVREADFLDGRPARGDARFAVNRQPIFELGNEVDIRKSGRKDASANRQNFAAHSNGFGEISGNMRERGEEKIAEIVAGEAAPCMEAVLKQAAQKSFIFRKGDHAVADIAGRKDSVFPAQTARAAPVVRDGDDRGEISDGALGGRELVRPANDVFLQAAKQRGKAGAAAESNHAEAAGERLRIGSALFHKFELVRQSNQSFRWERERNAEYETPTESIRRDAPANRSGLRVVDKNVTLRRKDKRVKKAQLARPSFSGYSSSVKRGSS